MDRASPPHSDRFVIGLTLTEIGRVIGIMDEVIEELSWLDDKPFRVEYQDEYGYRWQEHSRWRNKSSARYAAESLVNERGISHVRIVKVLES